MYFMHKKIIYYFKKLSILFWVPGSFFENEFCLNALCSCRIVKAGKRYIIAGALVQTIYENITRGRASPA